jgi:hypothetical protein
MINQNTIVLQLNAHKSETGMDFISKKASEFDKFLFAIQECLVRENIPYGLDPAHKVFNAEQAQVRTLIYSHKDLPVWYMSEFSCRDTCSVSWDSVHGKPIVSSVYWDCCYTTAPKGIHRLL